MGVASDGWTALRVEVPDEAADLITTFLIDEGAPGVLVDEPDPTGRPLVTGHTRLETHVPRLDADRLEAALRTYLQVLRGTIAHLDPDVVDRADVPATDWNAVFAAHHRPTLIGDRLLVAPPWDVPSDTGREVIVIEPGQAFGTGQHATTRGCLVEIEAAVAAGLRSGLDVGTGSGVLAIAMRRLGMSPVVATDVDRAVLPIARSTCDANGAADVALLAGRADAARGTFDLVVANLLADALVTDADALTARVAAGGRLVASGILDVQVDPVAAAYPGWVVTRTIAEDEWRTLRFERRP